MKGSNFLNTVQVKNPARNRFDLSHDVKMSGKIGVLYPTLVMECIPGDAISLGCSIMLRFMPLLAPVMHRFNVFWHAFFVPHRIVWPGWESFITQDPDDIRVRPYVSITSTPDDATSKFLDYMGFPPPDTPGVGPTWELNALSLAAHNKIWNEYYRNENLQGKIDDELSDGLNASNVYLLRNRNWTLDYLTGGLPFAQKGAAVAIPIGSITLDSDWISNPDVPLFRRFDGAPAATGNLAVNSVNEDIVSSGAPVEDLAYDPSGSLINDPVTLTTLRTAWAIQRELELNARGGTRYVEWNLSHFGVRGEDFRLQRPEYITGVKLPVVISEVLNTTGPVSDTIETPQGDMAGHGIAANRLEKIGKYYAKEHGYIIGILSVMPLPAYQQGVPRHFLKDDPYDYFTPNLAHIGEQPVFNGEVYAYPAGPTPVMGTFNYQPRYAEYRIINSRVAGDLRKSLDFWQADRIFSSPPAFNEDFVQCLPEETQRIFAVQDGTDNLVMHVMHYISASRKIPKFGTPL